MIEMQPLVFVTTVSVFHILSVCLIFRLTSRDKHGFVVFTVSRVFRHQNQ